MRPKVLNEAAFESTAVTSLAVLAMLAAGHETIRTTGSQSRSLGRRSAAGRRAVAEHPARQGGTHV